MTTVLQEFTLSGNHKVEIVAPPAAKVELVTYTKYPRVVVHLTTRGYKGIYHSDPQHRGEEYTSENAFADIARTKLQTPLEMLHTLWLLTDVSRAFTHQIVRYRIGTAFVQESMRFFGTPSIVKVLYTGETYTSAYGQAAMESIKLYLSMLASGISDQDARGILPTNILTKIYFSCSLRTLQGIMRQRWCCQAQKGEWMPILREMRKQISASMGEEFLELLRAPIELGEPCGYAASFDRPCTWTKGVSDD